MRDIGITGTRQGATAFQAASLAEVLAYGIRSGAEWFHHGDCVGVDATGADIAYQLGYKIHSHPPTEELKWRAWARFDKASEPKSYAERNRDIVWASDLLIVVPKTDKEQRGGTWMTFREAQRKGIPIRVIWPLGNIQEIE